MQAKNIKILYWLFTILFAGLMLFSAYGSILVNEDAKKLIHDQLGYPVYFIAFTGYAKLIGIIAILIPGLKTIKEWAYAGYTFNLLGASASHALYGDPFIKIMVPIIILALVLAPYRLWKNSLVQAVQGA